MDWLMYAVIGWVALVVLFWCLLLVAARAERRDADVSSTGAAGRADPPGIGRLALARDQSARRARPALARYEPDERLVRRGERER